MMKKQITVLGATGSIGKNAVDVMLQEKDRFEPVLLSSHRQKERLAELNRLWPKANTILSGEEGGQKTLLNAIAKSRANITLNGISGAAGLEPSMAAIESGSDLALANKETMVMAGQLVLQRAHKKKVNIIPVDSEHSAVFHLIEAHGCDALDEIMLTASGGPFRNYSMKEMKEISPQAALAHPTWNMGAKITIDSATMANKGLEVIEAARLFNLPPEKIKVVVHPQSIVHSIIRMKDGTDYAQLSRPDMRIPIQKALNWSKSPSKKSKLSMKNTPACFGRLDFRSLTLEFSDPDMEKFPLLGCAYQALKNGGLYPCAYNAANEAAVIAFLSRRIGFLDIGRVTQRVLESDWSGEPDDIASVIEADEQARRMAEKEIGCY